MDKDKNKKKTLTISSNLTKKIDISSFPSDKKKSFSISKKKTFKTNKDKSSQIPGSFNKTITPKKNINRKLVEQQATKNFIKKDEKSSSKGKIRLKDPINKRDLKMTVSRAMNVEEIEIKQRSLASVKRARLKEKKNETGNEEKKEFKKEIGRAHV